jgi:cell division inhibitor SepF
MWRKAMLYLGLGPDEEYDDYDPAHDDGLDRQGPRDRQPGGPLSSGAPASYPEEPSAIGAVRPINVRGERADSGVQVQPTGMTATPRPRPQVVRPIPMTSNAKPHVVVPDSFNEAQEVADKFKGGQPVIMNLQGADRDLSRRLIDFASGLCYGLGGQMERVGNQVYLLTPANVEVSAEERRRLQERGYGA